MKNQKGNTGIIVAIIVGVLVVGGLIYVVVNKNDANKTPIVKDSSGDGDWIATKRYDMHLPIDPTWSQLLPEIRTILKNAFVNHPEIVVERMGKINIQETTDITGDGVPEALVWLGDGGAYVLRDILMKLEGGKPVVVSIREKDRKTILADFIDGSSVRNGHDILLLSDKRSIAQGSYMTDDSFHKLESCSVSAYEWNSKNNLFVFSQKLSSETAQSYCDKVKEEIKENTP